MEFKPFPKMARLSREALVTEKIDGSNASISIEPTSPAALSPDATAIVNGFVIFAGSRTRWITPGKQTDNYGFAQWVKQNAQELIKLGPGTHFGEWFGCGIQRHYDLSERRFSLFNASRWTAAPLGTGVIDNAGVGPSCCHVVPTLYRGVFTSDAVESALQRLKEFGSLAAPGFRYPEGLVVYHVAAGIGFKKTLGSDGAKGPNNQSPS